jgi:hypothetical protein
MPRLNVIVLAQTDLNTYQFAMWADVPTARQTFYANPNAKSAWVGATAADNTNLQSGAVVENVMTQRVPPGTPLTQIEVFLQNQWQAYQTFITNNNPWVHYGSTWDGTTWTVLTGV